jgi:hypothetical protein
MNFKTQFAHFHNGSTLIGTVCFLMQSASEGREECVSVGFAFPSAKDVATKAKGRALAAGRAKQQLLRNGPKQFFIDQDDPNFQAYINKDVPSLVSVYTRRGINEEQLHHKVENISRWFFPQTQSRP